MDENTRLRIQTNTALIRTLLARAIAGDDLQEMAERIKAEVKEIEAACTGTLPPAVVEKLKDGPEDE